MKETKPASRFRQRVISLFTILAMLAAIIPSATLQAAKGSMDVSVNGTLLGDEAVQEVNGLIHADVSAYARSLNIPFTYDALMNQISIGDAQVFVEQIGGKYYAPVNQLAEATQALEVKTDSKKNLISVIYAPSDKTISAGNILFDALKEPFERYGPDNMVNIVPAVPSGGVFRDGLFIHPPIPPASQDPEDEPPLPYHAAVYQVDLTAYSANDPLVLDFYTGIIDNAKPQGIRFFVKVNDTEIFTITRKETSWIHHILDLSAFAGQSVKLEFATAPDPVPDYGWAIFAEPRIVLAGTNAAPADWSGPPAGWQMSGAIQAGSGKWKLQAGESRVITAPLEVLNGYVELIGTTGAAAPALKASGTLVADGQDKSTQTFDVVAMPAEAGTYRYLIPFHFDDVSTGTTPSTVKFTLTFTAGSSAEVTGFAILRNMGILNLEAAAPSGKRLYADRAWSYKAVFVNDGLGRIDSNDKLAVELVQNGRSEIKPISLLNPGKEITLKWDLPPASPGDQELVLNLMRDGVRTELKRTTVSILPSYNVDVRDPSRFDTIAGDKLTVAVYKKDGKAVEGHVYKKTAGGQKLLGTLPFGRLWLEGSAQTPIEGLDITAKTDSSVTMKLKDKRGDVEVVWSIEDDRVRMSQRFTAAADSRLKVFDGPSFLAGEGSFGGAKDSAVFPGIDYLDQEKSSNTIAVLPPFHERSVPHPYKVTIPAITIEKDNDIMTFIWDPMSEWTRGQLHPSVLFDSPNREGYEHTIVGMFAPSIPYWVNENKTHAINAFPLAKGAEIKLDAELRVSTGDHALDGVTDYVKEKGLPDVPEPAPRSNEEQFKLTLNGLEKEKRGKDGWISFIGFSQARSVELGLLHNLQTMRSVLDEADAARAKKILDNINKPAPNIEWSYTDSYWLRQDRDVIDDLYKIAVRRTQDLKNSQQPNGNWNFVPNRTTAPFGKEGDQTMGTTAPYVLQAVKSAKMTGSEEAWQVASKGLDAIAAFTKPTGAGPWELPLFGAESFASGLALLAAVEAYEYKKDPKHLELAVHLAETGLPFIYLWQIPDRKHSLYGSVASFSATNWRDGWWGRHVQWNGLVIADGLKQLAKYDQSIDWNKLADGIIWEGTRQAATTKREGRFPDNVDVALDKPVIQNIWPEWLLAAMQYDTAGISPHWSAKESGGVRVVSGVQIDAIERTDTGLKVGITGLRRGVSYTAVQTDEAFASYKINGETFTLHQGLLSGEVQGVRAGRNMTGYVFKVAHTNPEATLELIK